MRKQCSSATLNCESFLPTLFPPSFEHRHTVDPTLLLLLAFWRSQQSRLSRPMNHHTRHTEQTFQRAEKPHQPWGNWETVKKSIRKQNISRRSNLGRAIHNVFETRTQMRPNERAGNFPSAQKYAWSVEGIIPILVLHIINFRCDELWGTTAERW